MLSQVEGLGESGSTPGVQMARGCQCQRVVSPSCNLDTWLEGLNRFCEIRGHTLGAQESPEWAMTSKGATPYELGEPSQPGEPHPH